MKRFLFLVLAVIFWTAPAQAIEILKSSETATCADSGDGNPGAVTITIDEGNAIYAVALTVSDADGCNVTIAETNAVDGFMLIITNVSAANTATITTAANQYELEQGSPYVMGADDNVMFIYRSSKWLELGRTGALAGTFGGFSTTAGTAVVSNASGELSQTLDALLPDLAGGADLGSATVEWDDLFLHDGAVISGQEDQSATLTSSASLWTANNFAVDTQFKLPSSDAGPTATAGYLRHDNTISNHTRGGLVWHDGTNIRQVVDMVTATASACTAGQVVAYSADDDLWYCKDDANDGGATALDDIGDPDAATSISLDNDEGVTITSAEDTGTVIILENTDADLSGATSILDLKYTDDGSANGYYIRGYDNAGGDLKWSIAADGKATFGIISGYSAAVTGIPIVSEFGTGDLTQTFTALSPPSADGAALGTTSLEWSDLHLADGGIIKFGNDQDVTLTHVADAGLTLNSSLKLHFGDTGTYVNQGADGYLDLTADTGLDLNVGDDGLRLTDGTDQVIVNTGDGLGVTSISFSALNLVTTGTISGKIPMITKSDDYTLGTDNAQEAYGYMVWMTGDGKILTLPAVAAGMSVCVYSADSLDKVVDPNGSDGIRNGTTTRNADGHKITSGATDEGSYVCLVADSADGWTVLGKAGTWTDE